MDTKNYQKIKPQKKRFEARKNGFLEAKDRPRGRQGELHKPGVDIYMATVGFLPPNPPPYLQVS